MTLAEFLSAGGFTHAYRSLLYLQPLQEAKRKGIQSGSGPLGIDHYLNSDDEKGRLIQSLKSFLSTRGLQNTEVFWQQTHKLASSGTAGNFSRWVRLAAKRERCKTLDRLVPATRLYSGKCVFKGAVRSLTVSAFALEIATVNSRASSFGDRQSTQGGGLSVSQ